MIKNISHKIGTAFDYTKGVKNLKKVIMRRFTFFLAVMTTILGSFPFYAQAQETNNIPFIEVVGKNYKEVTPDRIYLSITLNEKDFKNTSLAQIENKMVSAIKKVGIDPSEKLLVKDMASNFKHYVILKSETKLQKQYQLLTSSAKEASEVLQELDKIGISSIFVEKVECSKYEEYKDEVRVKAICKAKEKAKLLVEAIGQNVGEAIYIYEHDYTPRNFSSTFVMKSNAMSDSICEEAANLEFEKIKIEAAVQVRFTIKE